MGGDDANDIEASLRGKGIDGMDKVRLGYLLDDGKILAPLRHEQSSEQLQAAATPSGGRKV